MHSGTSFAAASQTWNPNGTGGGTGSWAGNNWNSACAWVSGNTALFGGAAGTVTVGSQTAGGLTFNTTGYTLSAGTLHLTGTPIFDIGKGATATLDGNLTLMGAGGLTKTGPGNLLLLSAASTYTGATTVQTGTFSGRTSRSAASTSRRGRRGRSPWRRATS